MISFHVLPQQLIWQEALLCSLAKRDLFKTLKLETEFKFQIISKTWQICSRSRNHLHKRMKEGLMLVNNAGSSGGFVCDTETDTCLKTWVLNIRNLFKEYFFKYLRFITDKKL